MLWKHLRLSRQNFRGSKDFWPEISVFSFSGGKQEKAYEHSQAIQVKNQELSDAMKGLVYPTRLYPIPEEEKRIQIESIHIMRQYSIWSLIVLFLGLSFFGWLWEVTLHLVTNGELVNRGSLNGPGSPFMAAAPF